MEMLLYFAKVILSSGVLYFYYLIFLKDKTFHHYNRFYLLSVMVISVLLPLIKVSYFTLEVNNRVYLLLNDLSPSMSSVNIDNKLLYFIVFAFISGLGSLLFLSKFILGLAKIEKLKKTFKKENFEGINFYQTNLAEAPFSFFRNLFWKNSISIDSELGQQILKHEMVHIEQKHSWDKIFIEMITAILWFNPFFYFIKKEISLIHEYLADKKALKNSDTKAFAQMLLASHFSGNRLPATSPFLSSKLKKRLTMLKKSKTQFSYARRIFALPLLFSLVFTYMVNAKNKEIKNTNLEIEKLVSTVKFDTISPTKNRDITVALNKSNTQDNLEEVQKQIEQKQLEIQPLQEGFNLKNEETRKLSEELSIKSEQLRKFSSQKDFDSPKFKELDQEISQLSAKIDGIYNTEEFKNAQKLQDAKYNELDQLYLKIDEYYQSKELKLKIKDQENIAKEVELRMNSPKIKRQLKNVERQAKVVEKKINSEEFTLKIKAAEKNSDEAARRVTNSNTNLMEKLTIFIDAKVSTKEQMDQLDPNKIESMTVYKKGFEGRKTDEILIKLKK